MKNTIKTALSLIAMGLSAASAGHPASSVCQRLVAPAQQVPAVDWVASIYDPMDKLLNGRALDRSEHKLTPIEKRLLSDSDLRKALSVEPGAPLGIEHLEGTDIYRIDLFQGSASCQSMLFVEASAGQPPRRLPAPFEAQACITQYGRFGRAFGQRLFVVGGETDMVGLAHDYTISAWQGPAKGWTTPCELKLEFAPALKVSGRYCSSDAALCQAATDLAPHIVEAYGQSSRLDPLAFTDGRQPPESLQRQLESSTATREFPTFGKTPDSGPNPFLTSFSNAREPAGMALWIDGRWWYGLVGVAGIGWRESTTSLLIIYAVTDGVPVPAASFQVLKYPAGPARALWH